jgi:hypothetical protein
VPFFVVAFDFTGHTATVWDALDVMAGSNHLCLKTGHAVSVIVQLPAAAPRLHVMTSLARWSYGLEVFRALGLAGHPSPVPADRARTRLERIENTSGRPGIFAAQLTGRAHGAYQVWVLPKTSPRKSHYKLLVYVDPEPLADQYPGCGSAATGAPLEPCYQVTIKFEP